MYVTEKFIAIIIMMLEIPYNGRTSSDEKCLQVFVVSGRISWQGHFI